MSDDLSRHERRGPISWMAGHSVAANLAMLMCLVGGYMALRNIKQEVFPEFDMDMVTVSVAYPGASPEEVEDGIVLVIEEAVRGLDGVDEVSSTSNEGIGTVTVEMLLGADLQKLADDIQSEVDRITTFPEEAEEPQVRIVTRRRGVINLILYGDLGDEGQLLHQTGEKVRDQLLQDKNITQVELVGLPPLEIGIEISQENLRRYGLTLAGVAERLRQASVDLPGGGIKTESGEILVRVTERRDYGRQFAAIPIVTTAEGGEVPLGKIATIDDSFEETDRYETYNGEPAVKLEVYRVGDQTPVDVADAVRTQLEEIRLTLPSGISSATENDSSDHYRQRVDLLMRNASIGLVIVLVVLGLFLEARLAFWVMLGIPISFMGAFLVLPAMDVTINMISLFAFIIALGIVVDDAIVVGENVYHYHQQGMSFMRAAVKGTREVAMPVTFSVLTNVVAFLPMAFVPGFVGKIFRVIPVVVCTVFIISLFESLFILPAHLAHQRDKKRSGLSAWLHTKQQAFGKGFIRMVNNIYGPFLDFTLRHRILTVCFALSILIAAVGFAASGRLGFEQFPTVESDFAVATVTMPYGSPVAKTEAAMQKLLASARQVADECGHPELVEYLSAQIGDGGSHMGNLRVGLAAPEIRSKIMSTMEFTNRWREATGTITGVKSVQFVADFGGPGGRDRPVSVELSHRSTDVLQAASRELAATLETYPLTSDIDDGFQPGKEQLDVTIKPEGKSLGLTARDISSQIRSAFYGSQVLRQQRGRNEIKVMVRLPKADRSSEHTVNNLMIATSSGRYVPLREVAEVSRGRAYMTIDHRDGRRIVAVSANVSPKSKANEIIKDLEKKVLPPLIAKHPGLTFSFEGAQAGIAESMGSLAVTFPIALLAIYAMLAIPFRSYLQPLIVMISIPFGFVGAAVGHILMGYPLSIMSMFGIVALAGVVVNDSLVLVDFANRRRRKDKLSPHEAVHSAGVQRFRPVILTTLTTFGGLAPMIFETSRQARFLIPMALSLGFGILFATIITLILVPSLYVTVEDVAAFMAKVRRSSSPGAEARALADAARKQLPSA